MISSNSKRDPQSRLTEHFQVTQLLMANECDFD